MAIANIAEVEQSLGLESGKLTEMLSSEESHKIDLESKVIMDKVSFEERERNLKTSTIEHAHSLFIKELRNEFGLEFQGKTKENLVDAFKSKIENIKNESVKDPEERFKTLKTDFEKLQQIVQTKDAEIETIKNDFQQKEKTQRIKSDVFKHIPDNTLVSKNTILIEANEKGFTFDDQDGVTVIKDKQGNVLKNSTTLSPIDVKDWISEFVTPYVPKPVGGSGEGDDNRNSVVGSYESFVKEATKNGWTSEKINEEATKRMKEGTLKI